MGRPYIESATTLLHCNLLYCKNETSDVNMKFANLLTCNILTCNKVKIELSMCLLD